MDSISPVEVDVNKSCHIICLASAWLLSGFVVHIHQEKIISKNKTTSEKKAFLGGDMLADTGFQEETSKKKQSSIIPS